MGGAFGVRICPSSSGEGDLNAQHESHSKAEAPVPGSDPSPSHPPARTHSLAQLYRQFPDICKELTEPAAAAGTDSEVAARTTATAIPATKSFKVLQECPFIGACPELCVCVCVCVCLCVCVCVCRERRKRATEAVLAGSPALRPATPRPPSPKTPSPDPPPSFPLSTSPSLFFPPRSPLPLSGLPPDPAAAEHHARDAGDCLARRARRGLAAASAAADLQRLPDVPGGEG